MSAARGQLANPMNIMLLIVVVASFVRPRRPDELSVPEHRRDPGYGDLRHYRHR